VYGREADFEEKAETAITKMGKKQAKSYRALRKAYLVSRDSGSGKMILPTPSI
jgi:tryptophanyl-tRNA synthetase